MIARQAVGLIDDKLCRTHENVRVADDGAEGISESHAGRRKLVSEKFA